MVVYFLVIEFAFLTSAFMNDIYTTKIFWTSLAATPAMFIGVLLGTKIFKKLPEQQLKQIILYSLIILSVVGLLKTILTSTA